MRPLSRGNGERIREYVTNRAKPGMSAAERIHMHVHLGPGGCWLWGLSLDKSTGYGQITIANRVYKAHRVSYEAFVGPIPAGLHIDHLCRVRNCVNPEHLEPVTPLVNTRRSPITHGNETHCPQGHAYDEANTYRAGGRRLCRKCRTAYIDIYRFMTPEEREARKLAGLPVVDLVAHFATEEKTA